MKYLVAGGAGFLGYHLCKSLLDEGHSVWVIDNLSSSNGTNVDLLYDNYENFSFIEADISERKKVYNMPWSFSGIFNLACPASPVHYQDRPIETMLTSVVGTHHLLELAKSCGARFLQASTSEVYGDPKVHPQHEAYWGNVNSYGPRACYDEGKRAAEALIYDHKHVHGVDTRIVRIFNTYGPNMVTNDGRVVSNFIVQALRGKDITIYGDGSQTRSFCYVSDLIRGIRTVFDQDYTDPVNLGNPGEFTMLELAEKVLTITGSHSKIVHLPLPKDDPQQRRPDIALANSLGWKPEVSLDEGLIPTIEYFKQQLGRS